MSEGTDNLTPLELARERVAAEWSRLTPEERRQRLAEREAEQSAERNEQERARRSVKARKAAVLSVISCPDALLLVQELQARLHGSPDLLSGVCESLRSMGLWLGENQSWPDSTTQQPKGRKQG